MAEVGLATGDEIGGKVDAAEVVICNEAGEIRQNYGSPR